ncbi:MAG TPA: asparagine synthase (glutamine-hydrolyzing), partial [Bryobacteraceae bacterium]
MCGIAGFTHKQRRLDPEVIRRATDSIVHRGPDQQGTFQSDYVSLGAVRLKIIDLDGGRQPFKSPDGNSVIVYNGEVYNHAEIRRELEQRGHRFESRCDTEVVLKAFLEWDTASFAKLRGMYAFAIWNERERRLVLCRDRMGIKPLYLYRNGEDLYFGSELKTIFAHPDVERRLSSEGLWHYLSLNYIPAPFTMAAGVEKLSPGTWLEWRDGVLRSEPYWRLEFAPDARYTLDTAKQELDELLQNAISEHMVSDVPLGIWASGGLDSSTILHYASKQFSGKLKTFSVSFAGRKFDESPFFREMAREYATDHHEFDLNPETGMESAIEQLAYFSDEPSADSGALPVWFLSEMSRKHVTVALSGEGADELFGGYETYKADQYAAAARRASPAFLRRAGLGVASLLPVSDDKIGLEYKVKRFLAGTLRTPAEAHLYWNGTFDSAAKQRLLSYTAEDTARHAGREVPPGFGGVNRWLWVDQVNYLPDDILYKCDRMSMAHSLEVRPPFLDHRLVEFAARLPEGLKVNGSKLKYVLRELMRDKLPQSILKRKKQGFDIPAHHWLRTKLRPLLLDTVTREAVESTGLMRWPAVEKILKAHLSRKANYGYHLW